MGRELDAEVAEKVMTHPHANWRDPVPEYSTDIAAAWAVAELLQIELLAQELARTSRHPWAIVHVDCAFVQ